MSWRGKAYRGGAPHVSRARRYPHSQCDSQHQQPHASLDFQAIKPAVICASIQRRVWQCAPWPYYCSAVWVVLVAVCHRLCCCLSSQHKVRFQCSWSTWRGVPRSAPYAGRQSSRTGKSQPRDAGLMTGHPHWPCHQPAEGSRGHTVSWLDSEPLSTPYHQAETLLGSHNRCVRGSPHDRHTTCATAYIRRGCRQQT